MRGRSRKSRRDDDGEPPFALIPARRHFTALHPIFIMPFVITLTAVNTGESLYVPDQCERLAPPPSLITEETFYEAISLYS